MPTKGKSKNTVRGQARPKQASDADDRDRWRSEGGSASADTPRELGYEDDDATGSKAGLKQSSGTRNSAGKSGSRSPSRR